MICFDGDVVQLRWGDYDESKHLIRVSSFPFPLPIPFLKPKGVDAKPEHMILINGRPGFLVNMPKRVTIPRDGGKSKDGVKIVGDTIPVSEVAGDDFDPDPMIQNILDYLVERRMWEAFMTRVKLPAFPLLLALIGGMGIGGLLVMMLMRMAGM